MLINLRSANANFSVLELKEKPLPKESSVFKLFPSTNDSVKEFRGRLFFKRSPWQIPVSVLSTKTFTVTRPTVFETEAAPAYTHDSLKSKLQMFFKLTELANEVWLWLTIYWDWMLCCYRYKLETPLFSDWCCCFG